MENETENIEFNLIFKLVEEGDFSDSVVALIKLCDTKRILYEPERYTHWKALAVERFLKIEPPLGCNKKEFYECFSQIFEVLGDYYAMVLLFI